MLLTLHDKIQNINGNNPLGSNLEVLISGISRNLEHEISEWTDMFPHYR